MSEQRLLSPEDVARRCGLSRRAVYDAIRRGELPAIRLCNRLRIRPDAFEEWLAVNTVTAVRLQQVATEPYPRPSVAGSFRAMLNGREGTDSG